jgi:dihydropyrimidine dehydrogenase (NAD+) subunit PreA
MAKNEALGLPLSGIGGIETWIDALEFILVGASTLQVTTGIMHYGYRIVEDMIEGLSDFMVERGIDKIPDLVGKALPNLHETEAFEVERQGIAEYDLDRCIGCGQCYIVCQDAAGQAIDWDAEARRPNVIEDKCLSCMLCQFVCPVPEMISFKEMPGDWHRRDTAVMDSSLEKDVKVEPFTKEGPNECVI